jgi:hypothetical protein
LSVGSGAPVYGHATPVDASLVSLIGTVIGAASAVVVGVVAVEASLDPLGSVVALASPLESSSPVVVPALPPLPEGAMVSLRFGVVGDEQAPLVTATVAAATSETRTEDTVRFMARAPERNQYN